MITVQIPAAIRMCSPVYVTDGLFARASGIVGDGGALWRVRFSHTSAAFISADHLALIISDPTGAAHLAWWLAAQSKQAKAAANLAMKINGLDLLVVIENAVLGLPINEAGLTLLRDYALRVVSNG